MGKVSIHKIHKDFSMSIFNNSAKYKFELIKNVLMHGAV